MHARNQTIDHHPEPTKHQQQKHMNQAMIIMNPFKRTTVIDKTN